MLRNILAVFAGLFVGMSWNMALVVLNSSVLFPMPEGMSMQDPDQMNAWIATLPVSAFLVVLLAHLGQSFFGAWVAAHLAGSRQMLLAMLIGTLSLAGGVMNMMSLDHPTWMYIELPLYLVVAWVGARLATR
jgi:hypothetical protein